MPFRRPAPVTVFVLTALLWNVSASAQDLMLPKDSEVGFRGLMHMAQTGQLGDDVTNANIGVSKTSVRIELVRAGAPNKLFFLTPKGSAQTTSRYFNIEPGEGASASDVARIGKVLDEVFGADPFQLPPGFFETPPGGAAIPGLVAAWGDGGWRGVVLVLQRRMVALASLRYTIAVIVALAAALLASLLLLWGSIPPRTTVD